MFTIIMRTKKEKYTFTYIVDYIAQKNTTHYVSLMYQN